MVNRKARLKALQMVKESNAPIIKEASIIDFLKTTFSAFYQSIASQIDKNHPVLSAMNFISIGAISAYNPILGIILSILGTAFGINFQSIFLSIKNSLTPHLQSEDSLKNLDKNQDQVITGIVSSAVDSEVTLSDQEIEDELKKMTAISTTSGELNFDQLKKEGAIGAAFIQRFIPTISQAFGGGRLGIKTLITWLIKAILGGAGIIGITGASAKVFGVDPKQKETTTTEETKETQVPTTESTKPKEKSLSSNFKNVQEELKLSGDYNVIAVRPNNASNQDGSLSGKQWMVIGPLWETIYDWIFSVYVNSSQVFKKYNISNQDLEQAAKNVANDFIQATSHQFSDDPNRYRIPREYDNVKDVVDQVIKKAVK